MFDSMDVDSEENDIWNYKSVGEEKTYMNKVSQQETVSSRLSVKQRNRNYKSVGEEKTYMNKVSQQETVSSRLSVKQRNRTSCSTSRTSTITNRTRTSSTCTTKTMLIRECLYQPGKHGCDSSADVRNKKRVAVIDVNAENELGSMHLAEDKNTKNAKVCIDSMKSVNRSSVMTLASGKRRLSHCKLPPHTASPRPETVRSATSSSTPSKCESVQCPGIQRYFRPSAEKQNKRTSPKSGSSLFTDFGDDQLLIIHETMVAKKQIKLDDSLAADSVCNANSEKDNVATVGLSREQEVHLHSKYVKGSSQAAMKERDVSSNTSNIEHDEDNLALAVDSGYSSCVEKLHHSQMTSHQQLPYSASATFSSGFLVDDDDDSDVGGIISNDTFRDKSELHSSSSGKTCNFTQTAPVKCDRHLAHVDMPEFKYSFLLNAKIDPLVEDFVIVRGVSDVISQTDSPSVRAQTDSPSVTAQTDSPSMRAQVDSSSVMAQTNSPSVTAQTDSPSVTAQTNSPSVTAQTDSPIVRAQTDSPSVMALTNSPSVMAQTESSTVTDKQSILPGVQKQTSIFSFFKARVGSSCKATGSVSNKCSTFSDMSPRQTVRRSRSQVSNPQIFSWRQTSATSPVKRGNWCRQHAIPSTLCTAVGGEPELTQDIQHQHGAARKRPCPFYKKIHNTAITVDAFNYGVVPGCQAYVLTHFHYDHYGGLTRKFAQPIYCSQITGNLVEHRLGVDSKWINRLQMWKPYVVAGVTLTLMEANHCPGAVMVLFELKGGRTILHTGDFRACPEMEEYPMLKNIVTSDVYLDTTYCDPSYSFPTQHDVINLTVSLVLTYVARNPHTLIICGTYTIGKEKIFTAIAEALNSKICVTRDKKKVLECLDDRELQSRMTLNWSEAQVHVLPMAKLKQQALFEHHAEHPKFTSVLALEPTGWSHSSNAPLDSLRPKWSRNNVTLYGIPYSEHSSYQELKRFIQFLQPKKIIPTVNNGSPAARKKMENIFSSWTKDSMIRQAALCAT